MDEKGNVFSNKNKKFTRLKPFTSTTSKYLQIRIIDTNGKRRHMTIHRLVAETYIPNPHNLPEVNHKDKDIYNNSVTNLEWCTHKENLMFSYTTLSPVRNHKNATLVVDGKRIKTFESIKKACEYASIVYDVNIQSLRKYLCCGNVSISIPNDHRCNNQHSKMRNRKSVELYFDGNYIGKFPTMVAAEKYIIQYYPNEITSTKIVNNASGNEFKYKKFVFKRV